MTDVLMKSRRRRRRVDKLFVAVAIAAASVSILVLVVLLWSIVLRGWSGFNTTLLTGVPSRNAQESGIWPAMWGTILICVICGLSAVPIGVGTAIILEEYRPRRRWVKKLHGFVQLNIANLAGVPSVVYGILGLTVFVGAFGIKALGTANDPSFTIGLSHYGEVYDEAGNYLLYPAAPPSTIVDEAGQTEKVYDLTAPAAGQFWRTYEDDVFEIRILPRAQVNEISERVGEDATQAERSAALGGVLVEGEVPEPAPAQIRAWYYFQIPLGRSVMAGGLTLMLVVLPVVIISSQESLRAVPDSLRQGCLALGCTRWQTVWKMSLPSAMPGIMTGTILAMSRAIGEAAPILILAGVVFITFTPEHLMDQFTAMPLQIYNWAARPDAAFHDVAASGIILLLAILLSFNALAVFIRYKFQKPLS